MENATSTMATIASGSASCERFAQAGPGRRHSALQGGFRGLITSTNGFPGD